MNRAATIAAVAGLVLALVATGFLLFLPCAVKSVEGTTSLSTGETETKTETKTTCSSLLEANGAGILIFTLLPVMLAALALLFVAMSSRLGIWICTTVAFLLIGLSIFSIGAFYFPSLVAMALAAVLLPVRRGGPLEAEPTS
jgi:hypothetical protein